MGMNGRLISQWCVTGRIILTQTYHLFQHRRRPSLHTLPSGVWNLYDDFISNGKYYEEQCIWQRRICTFGLSESDIKNHYFAGYHFRHELLPSMSFWEYE